MPFPLSIRRSLLASALALTAFATPLWAEDQQAAEKGDAGAYLAAMVAASEADFRSAASWYARALISDPANPALLEGSVISNIGLGDMAQAAKDARGLVAAGAKSQTAYLALIAEAGKSEDFDAMLNASADGLSAGALLDGLVVAWAELGKGQMSEALESFDKLAKTKGMEAFGLYHKALALASAGDFEGADDILSGRAAGEIAVMRRGVIAHVQILSQLERNPDALALLDRAFGTDQDPQIDDLRRRLKAGEPLAFDVARNAMDGLGEVFFTLATALNGSADAGYTLMYARIATYLRPDHTDALLLTASLLQQMDQHDLATEVFAQIPADTPMFYVAEIGRAEATYAAGRKDAAIEILQGLARSQPQIMAVHVALADALRREERFADALKSYDTAIAMIGEPAQQHWPVFYSRGICEERLGNFDVAERDMRKALELQPDQPQVLNYLGYSFVDRGVHLDEALAMIERAVAGQPDSGYIIDSLAWAYFRLGRHEEAVEPMERASLLEPVDPIVTDHLGDVYWAVGRDREAEFQWRRALSFDPTEKDAARIRKKLEIGLDAVMKEEGAAPLAPVEASENDN